MCADRYGTLAPLIVLRDGDVERFFDVMKFRVHVLDIFAKTKSVDGFTA